MRNPLLAATLLAATVGLTAAASAQTVIYGPATTTGSARQADIVDRETGQVIGGIMVEQRNNFRDFVAEQRTPSYVVPGEIRVGTTLPDIGVTYYDYPNATGRPAIAIRW